jgi:hypothetical protein
MDLVILAEGLRDKVKTGQDAHFYGRIEGTPN